MPCLLQEEVNDSIKLKMISIEYRVRIDLMSSIITQFKKNIM